MWCGHSSCNSTSREDTDDLTKLDDPELFKKVNRSIGTTVQPTYYRERLHEAATGTEDTKQEVLTKDFNMWRRRCAWWNGSRLKQIRPLQRDMRIDQCTGPRRVGSSSPAWTSARATTFHTAAYLAARKHPSGRGTEFFADYDAWVKETRREECHPTAV